VEQSVTKAKPDRENGRVETDSGKERDSRRCSKERERLHSFIILIPGRALGGNGEMMQSSLDKLSSLDLVAQIEDKVGDDPQYIRLNGAIVGGPSRKQRRSYGWRQT